MQEWMRTHGLPKGTHASCDVEIFADGERLKYGALNFGSGNLTPASPVFHFFSITPRSHDAVLWARLSYDPGVPKVYLSKEPTQDEFKEPSWESAPLHPFIAKSENPYQVKLTADIKERSKPHENLLNRFYRYLKALRYAPKYSKNIDLALENPPVIIEAKVIPDYPSWRGNVRAAVAQLHEYRWLYLRDARLLFLASARVPDEWTEYLTQCHDILSAWPEGDSFFVEGIDEILPVASLQKKQCVFMNESGTGSDEE